MKLINIVLVNKNNHIYSRPSYQQNYYLRESSKVIWQKALCGIPKRVVIPGITVRGCTLVLWENVISRDSCILAYTWKEDLSRASRVLADT